MSNPWSPGPWTFTSAAPPVPDPGIRNLVVHSASGGYVVHASAYEDEKREFANHRLIAAAPEMAELLERILHNNVVNGDNLSRRDYDDAIALLNRIKANP